MRIHTLTIVGVGLIGASIGLAAKKRGLVQRVLGVGRDAGKLEQARQCGAIDEGKLDLADAVAEADLVVCCLPVDRIAEQTLRAAQHCKRGAVLSDAGSTKRQIVEEVQAGLPADALFVGAHPLAGSEKKGAEHGHADLFVQRWTVLTPTQHTPAIAVDTVTNFWNALGAKVQRLSPQAHDEALALTSHLPHLIASALAGILPDELRDLTATGFRDTTRVAGGAPEVWTPIFTQNRAEVLAALDQLEARLSVFRQALASNEVAKIDQLLAQGRKVRNALGS